ncbi:SusD/RagB family nutrient-binding outer membrane lipoprotein [Myroides sp. DW712]|uniref:SusD/RagB family nutrient-binding outer membrane lipoprotein n=1 Tax=Myroides sp. DW712 TaxID=3389800 RepID=UPI00397C2282
MKRLFLPLIGILSLATVVVSCEKIDNLQEDPNRVQSVTPDLLLTTIIIDATQNISTDNALASRQLTNTDGVSNSQYYNWQRADFDNYYKLKQIKKMQEEAAKYEQEVYTILALFFNSHFIFQTTLVFGDVPYTEALQVEQGITKPKYDTQKEIFVQILKDLERANELLAENNDPIKGDILYKGDRLKWRKLVNTYALRVLINLSNKTGDSDLKVVEHFQKIVTNPTKYPIFENNQDSAFLYFVDSKTNQYPTFNSNSMQTAYYLEESFVSKLQELKDSRLFRFAALKNKRQDDERTNFENYGGLKGSGVLSENVKKAVAGEASRINDRYYNDPINEPSSLISYFELNFILAEAAQRGWLPNDPATYYNKGIESSFAFFKTDMPTDYLVSKGVALDGKNDLELILTQKHIASFMNTGWNTFYDHRRTGFPTFNVDGGGVLNQGKIPHRWMYPNSEVISNNDNLSKAIERQFTLGDDINGVMWLMK